MTLFFCINYDFLYGRILKISQKHVPNQFYLLKEPILVQIPCLNLENNLYNFRYSLQLFAYLHYNKPLYMRSFRLLEKKDNVLISKAKVLLAFIISN